MSGVDVREVMRAWYADDTHQPFALTRAGQDTGALLIHGFTGSPADMRVVADEVFARGIDAHVMRLPGMASDIEHLNEMTGVIWREAVNAQWRIVAERYERALLLGYSLGGALAILAALERPPDRLVLIAPLSRIADRRAIFLPVIKHIIRSVRPYGSVDWSDARIHTWFRAVRPTIQTREVVNQDVLTRDAVYDTRMLDEMRRLLVEVRRRAPDIAVPTVVIQGTDDEIVRPKDTHRLAARLGGPVSLHDVPGDHYLPLPGCGWWPTVRAILDDDLRRWMQHEHEARGAEQG